MDEPEVWKPLGSATTVSTLVRLAGLLVPILEDGILVFCDEVSDYYRFSTDSTLTPTGDEVIASTTASGCFWIRLNISSTTTTSVTFRPGGAAEEGVYTSFAALTDAVGELVSPLTVNIDSTAGAATPAAGTYTFASSALTFRGVKLPSGAPTPFTLGTGVVIACSGSLIFEDLKPVVSGTSIPFTFASGSGHRRLRFCGRSTVLTTGSKPLATYPTTAGTDVLELETLDLTVFLPPSGTATSCIQLTGALGSIIWNALDATRVFNDAIGAPTAAQIHLFTSADVAVDPVQGGILDTGAMPDPVFTYGADASKISVYKRGTDVLVNGVSAAIATIVTANSRILVTRKAVNASVAIADLSALSADRTPGNPGSFKVTSVRLATLATETNDQSSFDWEVIG